MRSEHRALASAVRSDDGAQLTGIHVEVQVADGFEAVERFIHALDGEDEFLFTASPELATEVFAR